MRERPSNSSPTTPLTNTHQNSIVQIDVEYNTLDSGDFMGVRLAGAATIVMVNRPRRRRGARAGRSIETWAERGQGDAHSTVAAAKPFELEPRLATSGLVRPCVWNRAFPCRNGFISRRIALGSATYAS